MQTAARHQQEHLLKSCARRTRMSFSTSQLTRVLRGGWCSSYTTMLRQRRPRTSGNSQPGSMGLGMRGQDSTVLFLGSCSKVETLHDTMGQEENQFGAANSKMKALPRNTHAPACSPWRMQGEIQMDHSSSSQRLKHHGLITAMSYLVRSFQGWTLCTRSRRLAPAAGHPLARSKSRSRALWMTLTSIFVDYAQNHPTWSLCSITILEIQFVVLPIVLT